MYRLNNYYVVVDILGALYRYAGSSKIRSLQSPCLGIDMGWTVQQTHVCAWAILDIVS